MATSVANVFKNMVAPLSRSSNNMAGFTLDVLLETTISWGIRWLFGAYHGFFKILVTVALAGPLIGVGSIMPGMGSFANTEAQKPLSKTNYKYRFMLGLQSVPSIFLAQYVVGTAANGGFYNPGFDIWHILITIVARTLSRVIILFLNEQELPGMAKWAEYQAFQQRQIGLKYK